MRFHVLNFVAYMWHQFESVTKEKIAEDPTRNIPIEHTISLSEIFSLLE